MNLDLLIKLVKLANNNPNDNEANLAARKVCKMIAEGNYKFTADPKATPKKTVVVSNPANDNLDWIRKYYTEAPKAPFEYPKQPNYRPNAEQEKFYKEWKRGGFNPFEEAEGANRSRSKDRICTKCGQEFNTYDMKEPYVCFACQFIEHNARNTNY